MRHEGAARGRQHLAEPPLTVGGCLELAAARGQLVVQNKGMGQLTVRKPGWANRGQIRSQINGKDAQPRWIGGRMVFDSLRGNETVLITTPVNVETATYTNVNLADPQNSKEQYACEFRGHTAVDVRRVVAGSDPEDHNWYRLFRRHADEVRLGGSTQGLPGLRPPGEIARLADVGLTGGIRCQVSGVRCQVSGVRCQVSGVRCQVSVNTLRHSCFGLPSCLGI